MGVGAKVLTSQVLKGTSAYPGFSDAVQPCQDVYVLAKKRENSKTWAKRSLNE